MKISENTQIENWDARKTDEPAIDPEFPIIDPHHHLWDLRKVNPLGFRQEVYLCEQISDDIATSGHNIIATVFAQCGAFHRADGPEEMRCVGETEFVNGVVAMSRSGLYGSTRLCDGLFVSADLRLGPQVEEVLLAHQRASPNFRGIRSSFPSELDKNFLGGFQMLERHALSYDNWSPDFGRLHRLGVLANKFPGVTIVINHLGGKVDPSASEDEIAAWKNAIDAVAVCPNTVMKLGGVQMRVGDWEPPYHMHVSENPWQSDALVDTLLPWYQYALEAFGPSRCMFESNFPVDKECVSYGVLWNVFKKIASRLGLSETEKTDVFNATAARTYRLEGAQG